MIVLDIIWFTVMKITWNKELENAYWKEQSGMRTLAMVLCWVQIGLKGFIIFYLVVDFKSKHQIEGTKYLMNFEYDTSAVQGNNQQSPGQNQNDGPFEQNPY